MDRMRDERRDAAADAEQIGDTTDAADCVASSPESRCLSVTEREP